MFGDYVADYHRKGEDGRYDCFGDSREEPVPSNGPDASDGYTVRYSSDIRHHTTLRSAPGSYGVANGPVLPIMLN